MHVIAAKALAFKEALGPTFIIPSQVIKNAKVMANSFLNRGYKVVSGGQKILIFGRSWGRYYGKDADAALGSANITVNKNAVQMILCLHLLPAVCVGHPP